MNVEEAWAAGFLEGEGSFIVNQGRFVLRATQKEREPLEWLQRMLGGSICWNAPSTGTLGSGTWYWSCMGREAEAFTVRILPLLTSRRRAQVEMAFARASLGAPGADSAPLFGDDQLALDGIAS